MKKTIRLSDTDNTRIKRVEMVELLVPANQQPTTINFPDLPNLRHCNLLSIEFYVQEFFQFSPNGKRLVSFLELQDAPAFLTLENYKASQFTQNLPLLNLIGVLGASPMEYNFRDFAGQMVNFPKSYIYLPIPLTTQPFDRVFLFSVNYINPNIDLPKDE